MSNFIKFLLVSFVLPSMFFTQTVSALLGDINTGPDSECINLKYNLSPGKKDSNTNGEVTKLQTFLYDNGYLQSNPTGYFGLQTKAAVKAFQNEVLTEVQASDIDRLLITSSADRQELTSSNFVLSKTGNVYMYTRAKIAYVSCSGINTNDTVTNPIACTMDVKICPDGSAVGRVAPSCNFAVCPVTTNSSNVVSTNQVYDPALTTFTQVQLATCASSRNTTMESARSKGTPYITNTSYIKVQQSCFDDYYDVNVGDMVTLYGERLSGSILKVDGNQVTPLSVSDSAVTFYVPTVLRSGVSIISVFVTNSIGGAMAPSIKIHATCTSWTYSQYGSCQSNNKKVRTITSSTPMYCTGGNPEPLVADCISTTSSNQVYDPTFTTFTSESLAARKIIAKDWVAMFNGSLVPNVGDKTNWGNATITRLANGHIVYDVGNNTQTREISVSYNPVDLAREFPQLNKYWGQMYGINVAPSDNAKIGADANAYTHILMYGLGSNFTEQSPYQVGNSASGMVGVYKDTNGVIMVKTSGGNFTSNQFQNTNYYKALMDGGTTYGLTGTQQTNRAWPIISQ